MKKLIIINGPSCAGKSTVIDELFKLKKDFFWLKFDAVKRFFVDYDPLKDREKVEQLLFVIGKDRATRGEDILLENNLQEFVDFAKGEDYKVFSYNIEAPYEVLIERFRFRVLNITSGLKINTSEERHKEIYEKYLLQRNIDLKTFDTSVVSAEEIVLEILLDFNN